MLKGGHVTLNSDVIARHVCKKDSFERYRSELIIATIKNGNFVANLILKIHAYAFFQNDQTALFYEFSLLASCFLFPPLWFFFPPHFERPTRHCQIFGNSYRQKIVTKICLYTTVKCQNCKKMGPKSVLINIRRHTNNYKISNYSN